MALVTAPLVKALFTGFKANFQKGQSQAETQYQKIATVVPSTSSSNTYGWLGKFPSLKEWVGQRTIESIKAHGYSITNKKYESTVGIEKTEIEDDEVGVYSPVFEEMGRAAEVHPDEETFGLLSKGFTTLCYDGQNYFDTDHPVAEKADGTGTITSVANMVEDVGYSGKPWFVLDTSRAIKPLIFQQRKKPSLIAMTSLTDEVVFMSDEFRFGVDCRDAVGFSFWQLAFGNKRDLTPDNLWDSVTKMRGFKADGGRPLGIKPIALVVHPDDEKAATRMLERELDANSSNELKNRVELIVGDFL